MQSGAHWNPVMKHAPSRRLLIWLVKWLHYVSNRQRQIISGQLRLTYPRPGVGKCLRLWSTDWICLILAACTFSDCSFWKRSEGSEHTKKTGICCVSALWDYQIKEYNLLKDAREKNQMRFSHFLHIKFVFLVQSSPCQRRYLASDSETDTGREQED